MTPAYLVEPDIRKSSGLLDELFSNGSIPSHQILQFTTVRSVSHLVKRYESSEAAQKWVARILLYNPKDTYYIEAGEFSVSSL